MTQGAPSRGALRCCAIHCVLTSPMSGGAVFLIRCRTIHQPAAATTTTKTRMLLTNDCAAATNCSMPHVPVSAQAQASSTVSERPPLERLLLRVDAHLPALVGVTYDAVNALAVDASVKRMRRM